MERMKQLWDRLWEFVEEAFDRLGVSEVDASYWDTIIKIDYVGEERLSKIERKNGTFYLIDNLGNVCKLEDVDHCTLLSITDWLDELVIDHEDKLEAQERKEQKSAAV